MCLHISLDDDLVVKLDERVGPRGRSAFIAASVEKALENATRWDGILAALDSAPGFLEDVDDPAAWVREQRFSKESWVG